MGPLQGLRVVEFAGAGPAPFAAMLLADLGAEVVRIERPGGSAVGYRRDPRHELTRRHRLATMVLDLKGGGREVALAVVSRADALIEPFRPGVMERLGLGPEPCLAANPGLVYGRITGWGREGPLADTAGHDINYLALSGALHYLGEPDRPPRPPLALLGDYAGGGLYVAFALLAAVLSARSTGRGQVVDASILGGVTALLTPLHGRRATGEITEARGVNPSDGSRPWYRCYAARDGHVAVGAIEDRFYAELLKVLDLDPARVPDRSDPANWPALANVFAARIAQRTRDEWAQAAAGTDACLTPVLTLAEAARHPQAPAFAAHHGWDEPLPGPEFSETPARPWQAASGGLTAWGIDAAMLARIAVA